jgi:cbb3-type cytochrome oxidase maturation protein
LSVLYLLVPIAILFLIVAIAFFFWAIGNEQFDDLESPALKIVIDDHQQQHKKDSEVLTKDKTNKSLNDDLNGHAKANFDASSKELNDVQNDNIKDDL